MIAAGRFFEPAGFVFLHGRLFRQKGNGLVRVRCGGREVRRFVSGTGKPADEVTISLFREAWRLFRNSYFCVRLSENFSRSLRSFRVTLRDDALLGGLPVRIVFVEGIPLV